MDTDFLEFALYLSKKDGEFLLFLLEDCLQLSVSCLLLRVISAKEAHFLLFFFSLEFQVIPKSAWYVATVLKLWGLYIHICANTLSF